MEGNQREQELMNQIVQLQSTITEKNRAIDALNLQLLQYEGV